MSQPPSFTTMWASAAIATRSPGSDSASTATRFAWLHVATNTAASLPRSAAERRSSSLTVSSSPAAAQPKGADRIASHISSVGGAQKSDRRSIKAGRGGGRAAPPCARRR